MDKQEEDNILNEYLTNAPRLRNCEIMQYDEFAPHLNKESILKIIKEHDCIEHYAFIHHDKDLKEDGQPKAAHWHIFLHFKESQSFAHVASWFGVGVNYCNKFKSKKWQVAFAYAVHFFDNNKYQYPIEEVITDLDFEDMLENLDAERNGNKNKIMVDFVRHNIVFYREKYQFDAKKLREVLYLYDNYLALQSKERKDRNMNVLYLSGKAGVGKTTVAKVLATQRYSNDEIFISSSSNDILDGYQGEKCIILDDLRDDALKYADLLKFLDNNTNSSVKSRYSNKQLVRCELVIITSIKEPRELYPDITESKKQLYRRISEFMHVSGDLKNSLIISDYLYDKEKESYVLRQSIDVLAMVRKYIENNLPDIKKSFADTLLEQGLATPVKDDDLPF